MIIEKLDYGKDLISEIEAVCKKKNIKAGWFNAIGALKNVTYGFYDQNLKKYKKFLFENTCEITSCVGNISILDARIFIHAHINFADGKGNVKGGHFYKGEIFAAEVVIFPYKEILERKFDRKTGLKLWKR
jgi:predicted DNA-binding protein with PD1-like motif